MGALTGAAMAATLDDHLRPRVYRWARSIADLGAHHDDELGRQAAAAAAWHRSIARV